METSLQYWYRKELYYRLLSPDACRLFISQESSDSFEAVLSSRKRNGFKCWHPNDIGATMPNGHNSLCCSCGSSSPAAMVRPFSLAAPTQQQQQPKEFKKKYTTTTNPLEPIVITSRNIWDYLPAASRNTITILEFCAPSCRHCVDFAPSYSAVAEHYHGQQKQNIRVANINGAREQSLVTRFGIVAYLFDDLRH